MNSNQLFSTTPTIVVQRTKFPMNWERKTSFNAGQLIPICCVEGIPGSTVKMDMSSVIRSTTPIKPVMDVAYATFSFFKVPFRLIWEHSEEFFGENKQGPWITNKTTYYTPKINAPTGGWTKGTIADHIGIPTNKDLTGINRLPISAVCQVWNDWWRDENVMNFTHITKDQTTLTGVNTGNYITDAEKGGACLPVCKMHDYFTSALPEPQKGPDVLLPLGDSAPIKSTSALSFVGETSKQKLLLANDNNSVASQNYGTLKYYNDGTNPTTNLEFLKYNDGIYTDLSNATAATINNLRMAFAIQRMYEKDARGGTRYTEILANHFGVKSSDARLQRSEYLGGENIPLNQFQVLQTSGTGASVGQTTNTAQGNVSAYSLTNSKKHYFTTNIEEHCYILGFVCIRTRQTYQQGINKMFLRNERFDFYDPTFAHIGEQPIYNAEIFAQGNDEDKQVFGYQEAWADYRYHPSEVTGEMRSNVTGSQDYFHYANDFASLPTLSDTFIKETTANIDRTLTIASKDADQFIADFAFNAEVVAPIPLRSTPGLIDHL